MKKLLAIIEISRPTNLLITFITIVVAAVICKGKQSLDIIVLYAALSAMLVAAAGNIINDYCDFEIDKINRPNRVLPSGKISRQNALTFYVFFTILAIIISAYINIYAVTIVTVTSLLLFVYSFRLKGVPIIGNLIIAACTGLAFLYGGVAVGNWKLGIIPSVFAFLINLIREMLKDIEDLEGDLKNNVITFPGKYGIEKTKKIIITFSVILIAATFYPFVFKIYSIEYFLIVLFTVDLLLVLFIKNITEENFLNKISKLSSYLKLSMIFGLLAIYVG